MPRIPSLRPARLLGAAAIAGVLSLGLAACESDGGYGGGYAYLPGAYDYPDVPYRYDYGYPYRYDRHDYRRDYDHHNDFDDHGGGRGHDGDGRGPGAGDGHGGDGGHGGGDGHGAGHRDARDEGGPRPTPSPGPRGAPPPLHRGCPMPGCADGGRMTR
jgi:hypothetical protein